MTDTAGLPTHARVVVIGGGAAGASTAYHLTKMGWTDVVVLERSVLSAGTTWHSAGDIPLMKPTGLIGLVRYGRDLYAQLEQETGQSVGWRNCGYIKVAKTEARFEDYKRSVSTFNALGGAAEVIDRNRVKEIWPLADVSDIIGAVWEPGSGRLDPTGLVMAYAKGARSRGALFVEHCSLQGFTVQKGRVTAVQTSHGPIGCEYVVLCAGLWSRSIGAMAGVNVPLHATEHFYMLTKPVAGIHSQLPILNDPDNNIYMREDVGGLLVGCFEPGAKPLPLSRIPAEFSFGRLEEDWDHVEPYMARAMERIPALKTTEVRLLMNGPESFTPDGSLLVGEAPELRGFFVLAGFNSGGVAMSAGMGRTISEWVIHGRPSVDMTRYDIRRFGDVQNNDRWLASRVAEIVGRHMAVPVPGKDYDTARNQRLSPFHRKTKALGARYGSLMGWERPLWYGKPAPAGSNPYVRPLGAERSAEEHRAAREAVAMFDLSSFAKFMLCGPQALDVAQKIFANNVDVPVGRIVYTAMLNDAAGTESDLTVVRLGDSEFLVVTSAGQATKDYWWIKRKVEDEAAAATVQDVTSSYGVLAVCGPSSRELLSRVSDCGLSNSSFPYMTARRINISHSRVLALRVSYAGELGWELYVPPEMADDVFDSLWSAGADLDLRCAGYNALGSLRAEKGYRSWGRELLAGISPARSGLMFAVDLGKEFIGKAALIEDAKRDAGATLAQFCAEIEGNWLYGDEPIYKNGQYLGLVSSAAYGHTVGKMLAFAWIPKEAAADGDFEIEVAGVRYPAQLLKRPPYDPRGERLKS